MEKYTEILKLKDMLEKAGIPFKFEDSFDGYHICYPKAGEERVCSVIEHCGSYGHDKDLLEIMGLLTEEEAAEDDVAGWLTAENVFSRIKADFDKRSR